MFYTLSTPKDAHGQPLRMFKANLENNVSKAIDQLSGICSGILADGVVIEAEAQFFAKWVRKFAPYEPVWPFTDILAHVERIFADGHTKEAQRDQTRSTTLPLDSPQPEPLLFPGQQFVVTGRFAYGTRRKVFEAIEALGGVCGDSAPTRTTRYLVIGVFASRDWYNTNYGRKIERAVKLRDSGTGISIVSEEHWKRFLQPTGNA